MYAWSHIDADDGRKIRMMTFGPISIRRDPEPYFVAMRNPEAFEKYGAEFPPKEKLVLPGQLF